MKELATEEPAHYFIMSLNTHEVLGYVAAITDAVADARRIVERIETHNGRGR